jgi:hypothetical protein
MKNKIRLIDINIVSAYMGRVLTVFVTILVLAITLSALFGDGGLRNHVPLVVEVPASGGEVTDPACYRALRFLIAAETGRSVSVATRGPDWSEGCELYVLPIREFFRARSQLGLEPLYAFCRARRGADAAVLIARGGTEPPVPPARDDVVFVSPRSINGCWIQLAYLESSGFDAPRRIGDLRFAPGSGDGSRVVYSVAFGRYAMGACRASDLEELAASGGITPEEVFVVASIPALPETVVACPADARNYFEPVLRRIAATVADPEPSDRVRDAVTLLRDRGVRNLRPVTQGDLERLEELLGSMEGRTTGTTAR